ncbi:hypothetical protein FGO68_gene16031 [Halteria grandinella]|uniref:Uncharacterized protein n=1 Tax=Halteria grandinella TaxID=5974 RepID=A0A8J8P5E5_HALGN|nr:hypothetical protein FGO68_gene16031 [Halteria grandinella]
MGGYSHAFIEEVSRHTLIPNTNYNIQKQAAGVSQSDSGQYFFQGYPQGNFLKQVIVIMGLWKQLNRFPITFRPLTGLDDTDETSKHLDSKCFQRVASNAVSTSFPQSTAKGTSRILLWFEGIRLPVVSRSQKDTRQSRRMPSTRQRHSSECLQQTTYSN